MINYVKEVKSEYKIDYVHPRRVKGTRVLKAGESVNLTQLAREMAR